MKPIYICLVSAILNLTFGQISTRAAMAEKEQLFQAILNKTIDQKKVFGASFAVKQGDQVWSGHAGNFTHDQPYFIASTTKLFTTAIVLNLKAEGKLTLDDQIAKHLDPAILARLHVFKGHDYSQEITIRQLLGHTSGLPDYFQGKSAEGHSLENELTKGKDQHWTFEQVLDRAKAMKPHFEPGAPKKAHYSDTNFQLLGKIIESITGLSYAENCERLIFRPLQLHSTYVYNDASDTTPKTLHYKADQLHIPKAMTAFGPDGGIVSTNADMLTFLQAFFAGKLFPEAELAQLQAWNKIFFPMESGIGIHRFKLPWIFNPTGAVPDFIGHSGLSGALAYYSPKANLWIVGTVNQVAHPDISFRTMIKLAQVAMKK